jgi:hypothetical protein
LRLLALLSLFLCFLLLIGDVDDTEATLLLFLFFGLLAFDVSFVALGFLVGFLFALSFSGARSSDVTFREEDDGCLSLSMAG